MKILVVCQLYYPENVVITNIAEKLVELGNDVTVLTGKPNYGYGHILEEYKDVKFEEHNGVKIHRVNLKVRGQKRLSIIRNYLSFWKNSKRWVKRCKEKYDIVFSMSLSPVTILAAGNLYKKIHHVKHIVYCVDLWPESTLITHAVKKNSLMYKIIYKWSRSLYSKADRVIIGSPSFDNYFKEILKLNNPTTFIPQPSLVEESDIEPYQYPEGFNILYCGNIGRIQLVEMIPDAMKNIKDKNIRFHIIGMGPLSDELLRKIKEYHLEDNVIYHGPIIAKKAAAYFKSADALYVSLKGEGYVGKTIPNKLVMYMAFNKPIIAMIDGDGKEILKAADGGIICEENIPSLTKSIEEMHGLSKKEKEKLGHNNRVYYEKHLSLDIVGKEINDVLFDELS